MVDTSFLSSPYQPNILSDTQAVQGLQNYLTSQQTQQDVRSAGARAASGDYGGATSQLMSQGHLPEATSMYQWQKLQQLKDAGTLAGSGDNAGAAKKLYEGGLYDQAEIMRQHMKDASDQAAKNSAEVWTKAGNLVRLATDPASGNVDPVKWGTLVNAWGSIGGDPNFLSKISDPNTGPGLALAMSSQVDGAYKQRIEQQKAATDAYKAGQMFIGPTPAPQAAPAAAPGAPVPVPGPVPASESSAPSAPSGMATPPTGGWPAWVAQNPASTVAGTAVQGNTATVTNENFNAANRDMGLTPQEQALYQRHLTNLTGPGGVDNANGSRSTLYQTSVEGPGGRTYNIPTVWDGKILPPAEAIRRVAEIGWDKFPSYGSEDEAEARYQQMHNYMERDTGDYLRSRGQPLQPGVSPAVPVSPAPSASPAATAPIPQTQTIAAPAQTEASQTIYRLVPDGLGGTKIIQTDLPAGATPFDPKAASKYTVVKTSSDPLKGDRYSLLESSTGKMTPIDPSSLPAVAATVPGQVPSAASAGANEVADRDAGERAHGFHPEALADLPPGYAAQVRAMVYKGTPIPAGTPPNVARALTSAAYTFNPDYTPVSADVAALRLPHEIQADYKAKYGEDLGPDFANRAAKKGLTVERGPDGKPMIVEAPSPISADALRLQHEHPGLPWDDAYSAASLAAKNYGGTTIAFEKDVNGIPHLKTGGTEGTRAYAETPEGARALAVARGTADPELQRQLAAARNDPNILYQKALAQGIGKKDADNLGRVQQVDAVHGHINMVEDSVGGRELDESKLSPAQLEKRRTAESGLGYLRSKTGYGIIMGEIAPQSDTPDFIRNLSQTQTMIEGELTRLATMGQGAVAQGIREHLQKTVSDLTSAPSVKNLLSATKTMNDMADVIAHMPMIGQPAPGLINPTLRGNSAATPAVASTAPAASALSAPRPAGLSDDQIRAAARASGKDPNAIAAQLKAWGVEP